MRRIFPALIAITAFAQEVDFKRDVEPIFRSSCAGCHAGKQSMGQLRLDAKKLALKGGISGPLLAPGDSKSSRLMQRVLGEGGQARMPMGGKLPDAQIATLRRWIDSGAKWPDDASAAAEPEIKKHWAYVKPVRPAEPAVKNAAWARNAMDRFVLARLEKEGLKPSPEASRETLIRRLSLDLIGLPPTPAEIDAFVSDRAPDAYEKLVERLLASPHYGERQARPWLDLARYADTNGFEKDRRRSMWTWRDWVINAFNRDLPFDRFTIEQLAGDLLPQPSQDQLIATGFHRNTMYNEEGGVDKDEAQYEVLVDRVNTTATVWLGSTLGCTQCHNHKFDPFTQKEYYQLMAFFNNGDLGVQEYGDTSTKYTEPQLDLPTPAQERRRTELTAEIKKLDETIKTAALEKEQKTWEESIHKAARDWKSLAPASAKSSGGSTLSVQPGGAVLASGANPATDEYTLEFKLPAKEITAFRIEALPHASLPRGGPGRDAYGNFFLAKVTAEIDGQPVSLKRPIADDGRINDGKFTQLWTVDASREDTRLPRMLVFAAAKPFGKKGQTLRVRIAQQSEFGGQGVGHFRIAFTTSDEPLRIVQASAKVRPLLAIDAAKRTKEQQAELAKFHRGVAASLEPARKQLAALRKELDGLGIANTLIVRERKSAEPPSAVVRLRGAFLSKGETVTAGVPASLQPLPANAPLNRLTLAQWLVSPDNPLTARVAVNRIWEQYFGRGLVETSEDFGTQGDKPTHPELLDWLATEFMRNGWSVKQLHRTIVLSAAYRQSSAAAPALVEKDPYNRLLARGPRFRVEAEMVRDIALANAGLLSRKIGGPSVFPFQPEGIWDIPYSDDKWTESQGEDRYRRGLYTFARRTAPYPSMLTFDAVSREFCTVRRVRTNTPLQALTTLNDPAFFETARALAKRTLAEGGASERERLDYAFRLCTSRKPSGGERDRLFSALERERGYFLKHPEEAAKLGGSPEAAAWTMLSNVLLNLDEALTKE